MMNHTIAFQKACSAYRLVADLVDQFPKSQRYSLGNRMETNSLELIEWISQAEVLPDPLKGRTYAEATAKADVCGVLIRLCLERKLIGETNYFVLANLFQETAKCCVGLNKSLR